MDVAGVPCVVCEQPVAIMVEAVGCPACDRVAHQRCAGDRHCPICGGPLVSAGELDRAPTRGAAKLRGVRGWLAVFVAVLAMSAAVNVLVGGVLALAGPPANRLAGLLLMMAGLYSGWASKLLMAKDIQAPRHAMLAMFATAVVGILDGWLVGNMNGAGRPLIGLLIWGTYLAKSRRVAETYERPTAQPAVTTP
jgi:hypothetical protein